MSDSKTHRITALLSDWGNGNMLALDQLEPLVREALNLTARRMIGKEWNRPTLEPGELVNEAWIKILEADSLVLANRQHFYNLAGRIMRRFLINRAVARKAGKKQDWLGRGVVLISPENLDEICGKDGSRLLEMEDALERLRVLDARKERIITLYCYCGFKREKIADIENISISTVKRELKFAFSWLRTELQGMNGNGRI